jgi:hypothetical protein
MPVSVRASLLVLAALALGGVLACSGGGEASVVVRDEEGPVPAPSEARTALNEALQAFNRYCLAPTAQGSGTPYPIALVRPGSGGSSYRFRQLSALREVGLLDTTVTRSRGGLLVHRFGLTQTGRQSQYEIAQGQGYRRMFCYAVPRVTRLDSIKAVYNAGPNPLARAWFTYGYADLGTWVEAPAVQRAFTGLAPLPSPQSRRSTQKLLIRVDSAWVDRRLTGYERPPERPSPPSEE